MRIGCLGWGSLIWNPNGLPICSPWFTDGPLLPIEFARFSSRSRVSLVIVEGQPNVPSLWALMNAERLDEAVDLLARRENVKKNVARDIGRWKHGDSVEGQVSQSISSWAILHQLDAVVWTALGYKIVSENDQLPSLELVIARLRKAENDHLTEPREYVEKAPQQIDTGYRRAINERFGWKCTSDI